MKRTTWWVVGIFGVVWVAVLGFAWGKALLDIGLPELRRTSPETPAPVSASGPPGSAATPRPEPRTKRPIRAANPRRVDLAELYSQASELANEIVPGSDLAAIEAAGFTGGAI